MKGKYGPVPTGVKYVGDKYDITYSQSATALSMHRRFYKQRETTHSLLAIADPVFSPKDSRVQGKDIAKTIGNPYQKQVRKTVITTMGLAGMRSGKKKQKVVKQSDAYFPRLDKTSTLAINLQKNIFAKQKVDILTGVAASERQLRQYNLSQYKYLVFATHGILDNTLPYIREPALILSQVGIDEKNNGFLTLREVMGLKLHAEVVALTACQTGLGKNVSGEGVMGLGRAFRYAGAKSVLVSLWRVAEDSTTAMAEKFFWHLTQGKTKRKALRLARNNIRKQGYKHPFFWAPFILIGEGE